MKKLTLAMLFTFALMASAQADLNKVTVDMRMFAEYTVGCMIGAVKYDNMSRSEPDRLYTYCMKYNVRDYDQDTFPTEFKRHVVAEFLYSI